MRWILALVAAGGLSLATAQSAHAQVIVGNPWGGVAVGSPWVYSSGFRGVVAPGFVGAPTVVSPGVVGVAPAPMVWGRTFAPAPVWGGPVWGVNRFGRVRRWGAPGVWW